MSLWNSLEGRSATAFLVGAVMFAVSAALVMVTIVAGAESLGRLNLTVGEAFIAGGWIAGLVGLLGLYPGLVNRSRWLARAGAVFAAIGMVTFLVLAVISLVGFFTGVSEPGDLPIPIVFIIPGVFVGSFLAFVSFSGASLRSDVHSRTVSILLLVPTAIFLTNLFVLPVILGPGPSPPVVALVVVVALALANFAIGYTLRTETELSNREGTEGVADATAKG